MFIKIERYIRALALGVFLTSFLPVAALANSGDTSTFMGKIYTGDGGLATEGYLDMPQGFVFNTSGDLFIADTVNNVIRKIDTNGILSTEAGGGQFGTVADAGEYGLVNGPQKRAQFAAPEGIDKDSDGNLYIADTGNNIIRVMKSGVVSSVPIRGTGKLKGPRDVIVSGDKLYISDTGNNRIVSLPKIGGALTALATGLKTPGKMVLVGDLLYVTELTAGTVKEVDTTTGATSIIASDLTEPRAITEYNGDLYLTAGENGVWNELWLIDMKDGTKKQVSSIRELIRRRETASLNNAADILIREVNGTPVIYELFGGGSSIYTFDINGKNEQFIGGKKRYQDEVGLRSVAQAGRPNDVIMMPDGKTMIVAYSQGNKIGGYSFQTNQFFEIAGHPMDSYKEETGSKVRLSDVVSMAVTPKQPSKVYLVDRNNNRIRILDIKTKTTTYLTGAGEINSNNATNNGYQEGAACNNTFDKGVKGCAYFNRPTGITITKDGKTIYVADAPNNRIRKVDVKTGKTSLIAGSGKAGFKNGKGTSANFNGPFSVTLSSNEKKLYVTDKSNHAIREIDLKTKIVTTLAGTGKIGYREGTLRKAVFSIPEHIELGPDGNLYVSEAGSLRIRKIDLKKKVTTLVSGSGRRGKIDGSKIRAEWNVPKGFTFRGNNMYVTDIRNDVIRRVDMGRTFTTKK